MAKSRQNQVPEEFDSLYTPILRLKKLLLSKTNELAAEQVIHSFVLIHYSTFLMICLYRQLDLNVDKVIEIRDLVELILSKDSFLLIPEHKAKISSFIDNLGKQLNVTYKPYVYIAMYSAHLDAEIYRHFNPLIGIYDFIDYYYVEPETVARMKQYSDVSFDVLADLKLSPYKQGN